MAVVTKDYRSWLGDGEGSDRSIHIPFIFIPICSMVLVY